MTRIPEQPQVGSMAGDQQPAGSDAALRVYRLVPAAGPEDSNWDNAPAHGIVTVCAASPADARIVAAEAELDFLDIDAKPGDGTTTRHASAFRNEKLYHVEETGEPGHSRGIMSRD